MAETFKRDHDAEDVVDMLKTMITNYINLSGRVFISYHDADTTRTEIIKCFNDLRLECMKFVDRYDFILPDNYSDICRKMVYDLIYQAKHLMLDLYDDDLDDFEVLARAIKRGDAPYEF